MATDSMTGGGGIPNGASSGYSPAKDIDNDHRCGYMGYRPSWLQVFNNPKFLLVLLSAYAFIQSFVVNGICNLNSTSYERRFGLSSSEVGLISSAYDISAGVLVIPVTYFALRGHKHFMLAVAIGLMGVGSLLMWLPHFTTEDYVWGNGRPEVCTIGNSTSCPQANTDLSYYLYILIAGQLLHGVGGTMIYSVGISCMDDCVSAKSSPLYVGVLYGFNALGPAVGYVLGGYLLDFYVDFDTVERDFGSSFNHLVRAALVIVAGWWAVLSTVMDSTELTPEDPRWVGAWWLGFVISMALSFAMVLPFMGLPRELPETKAMQASRISETHDDGSESKGYGTTIRDFPRVTLMLLKNPTFMFITAAASSEGIIVHGFGTFLPKFIQNQFAQTASTSAILSGVIAVPGAVAGFLLGGYLCRRFQLKIRGIMKLGLGFCVASVFTVSAMWAKCDVQKMAGINVPYEHNSMSVMTPALEAPCNAPCGCDQESYAPVCGSDGIQYFSACHAGCLQEDGSNFKSCGCINSTVDANQTAGNGVCDTSCPMLYVFLPVIFLAMLLTCTAAAPSAIATMRCVPSTHKTFALGVQWLFVRFLGTVPGPILFGAIIDSACVIWKKGCGSEDEESCWVYNNFEMSRNFFLVGVGIKCCSCLSIWAAGFLYKPPSDGKEEKGDNISMEINNQKPIAISMETILTSTQSQDGMSQEKDVTTTCT